MRTGREYYWTCIIVAFALFSCKKDKTKDDIIQVVAEWTGKKIVFPEGIPCQLPGKDTFCIDPSNQNYKIMLYVDSTGCNSCRLRLAEWKQLISEVDALFPGKTDFLIFYQPKQRDVKELVFHLEHYDFQYPVYLDIENKMDKTNRFPSDPSFQCFLLDKDNKVVLIGNPATNPQIWELFKEQISGEKRKISPWTTVLVNQVRQELSGLKVGGTYSCVFEIENTGSNPFVIAGIHSSCGCTVPAWDRQPVRPGGKTEIKVEVKPETSGFFNKTIDVYGNIEQSVIKLTIIGTVE